MALFISGLKITAPNDGQTIQIELGSIDTQDWPQPCAPVQLKGPITVAEYPSFHSKASCFPPTYSGSNLKCGHSHPNMDEVRKITHPILYKEFSKVAKQLQVKSMITTVEKCASFFSKQSFPSDPTARKFAEEQVESDRAILAFLSTLTSQS